MLNGSEYRQNILLILDVIEIMVPIIISIVAPREIIKTLDIGFIFQIEEVFLREQNKRKRPLLIVIEDVERSKTGQKLIETIHYFIYINKYNFK